MSIDGQKDPSVVPTGHLLPALQEAVNNHHGGPRPILSIARQRSEYRSSFALEEITVELADGAMLSIMFKDLSRAALTEQARAAKPRFLYDPCREIVLYQRILGEAAPGAAACWGAVVDVQHDRFWLFLEKVPGVELYMVGELIVWQQVARWLARLHRRASLMLPALPSDVSQHLLRFDASFCRQWIDRALRFASPDLPRDQTKALRHIANRYDLVIDHIASLPETLVHGDFYPSNVLVQSAHEPGRVAPIDWELSGIGTGLLDLAALISGSWIDEDRSNLVMSYFNEFMAQRSTGGSRAAEFDAFQISLSYCRLHLAIQWLGWSSSWSPPSAHAHDWLAEAIRLHDELGL